LVARSRWEWAAARDRVPQGSDEPRGAPLVPPAGPGSYMVCGDRRIGSYPIQVLSIEVGARRPLGVSSAGVAILAAMPAQDVRRIVAANEARFAAYRTDVSTVLAQVTAARRRGFNLRDVGLVQGTKSISTWIKAGDHRPVAAITMSAVRTRLGPRREAEIAEILLDAARAIEDAIRIAAA